VSREGKPRGAVDHLVVGGDVLIASGWVEAGEKHPLRARLLTGEREVPLRETEVVRMTRRGVSEALGREEERFGFVLLGEVDAEPEAARLKLALDWDQGEARLECPARGSLRALLGAIAAAPPDERTQIRAIVERRIEKLGDGGEDLPPPDELDPSLRAHVDRACLIPGRGVFLYGWILDPEAKLQAVHFVGAGDHGPNLLEHGARYPRPDVDDVFPDLSGEWALPGLLAFAQVERDDSPLVGEMLFVTHDGGKAMLRFPIEDPVGGPLQQLEVILAPFRPDEPDAAQLLARHVGPAVEGRWQARRPVAENVQEHQFGVRPTDPPCSIVVPLFARYDFLLYQLSLFARDPELAKMDLIYVIDDERICEATIRLAREVAPLWPVPFRILALGQNLGYAGANNAGARIAEGEFLLLLNSDVIPDRPGWLRRLCEKHRSLPECGALAPRLLFEDGSIQHDGITFVRHPKTPEIWLNGHPGKGLAPSPAEESKDVVVPAVTGACMLVRREIYLDLEGLDEGYVFGDFEDSDLCLRLRERDLLSYCARGETLYHLERQSVRHTGHTDWRTKITLYNAWRHTQRWQSTLEELATDEH
jgi:GT2 family glycosyltransferase